MRISQIQITNTPMAFTSWTRAEVQARKPNAQMKLISSVTVKDGSMAQATLPMTVAGKHYLVFVDEGGSVIGSTADIQPTASSYTADSCCLRGRSVAFSHGAHFRYRRCERDPKLVSKLMLETHDPANCSKVMPDLAGLAMFTLMAVITAASTIGKIATAACVRLFQFGCAGIRHPESSSPEGDCLLQCPAGARTEMPGSLHALLQQWHPGGADWCASRL